MQIRVINPNTTAWMTDGIRTSASAVAAPGTTIVAVNPTMGPVSIESHYDEALAVPGLLEQIAIGNAEGADAFVVACFGDPGLDAARELAQGPVIGIAEAAMHLATLVGRSFSIVTTLSRTSGRALDLVRRAGFDAACVGIRACEIAVLDLDDPRSNAYSLILDECQRAVADDGADSIVLGCAGMASLFTRLSSATGVPVIDGVAAATKLAESLVAIGATTSRRSEYATPLPKPMTGLLNPFTLEAEGGRQAS